MQTAMDPNQYQQQFIGLRRKAAQAQMPSAPFMDLDYMDIQ